MGRMATMSPLGLYRWDDTIFDLMQIPQAMDKQTLIDNLLTETAELEVVFSLKEQTASAKEIREDMLARHIVGYVRDGLDEVLGSQ